MRSRTPPLAGHTPGPWYTAPHTSHGEVIHAVFCRDRSPDGLFLGSVGSQPAENEANARLIAAAPDLLAALEWIVSQEKYTFAECSLAEEMMGRARAAIMKATGAQ